MPTGVHTFERQVQVHMETLANRNRKYCGILIIRGTGYVHHDWAAYNHPVGGKARQVDKDRFRGNNIGPTYLFIL